MVLRGGESFFSFHSYNLYFWWIDGVPVGAAFSASLAAVVCSCLGLMIDYPTWSMLTGNILSTSKLFLSNRMGVVGLRVSLEIWWVTVLKDAVGLIWEPYSKFICLPWDKRWWWWGATFSWLMEPKFEMELKSRDLMTWDESTSWENRAGVTLVFVSCPKPSLSSSSLSRTLPGRISFKVLDVSLTFLYAFLVIL